MEYGGLPWALNILPETTMDYHGLFMGYHVLLCMDYHLLFMDYHRLPWATMNHHGGPWTVRELSSMVVRGSPW